MAEDDQEESQKTEDPTPRRIEEAVKRGQVAYSREVGNFLVMLFLTFWIVWLLPGVMKKTVVFLRKFLESPHDIVLEASAARHFAFELLRDIGSVMAVPLVLSVAVALFASFVQNGVVISGESVIPKFEKISPMRGLKRMFSMRSMMEFVKGLIKIAIVGFIGVIAVWPFMAGVENLPGYEAGALLFFMGKLALRVMIGVSVMMGIIAVLDYLYQRFEYLKSLRMTKREVKEEFKQTEGDPVIKGRLKSIRMERARRRMMSAVPKADVVITNPTHYAVALKYEEADMRAPVMVAKGRDLIAHRIRKVAEENRIPIVENPPLARALYTTVELDQEIPERHYQAVAEVIAYVYKMRNKKRAA